METEIKIYLLLAVLCFAARRTLSGLKNACFYAKGAKEIHPWLQKFVRNLHFVETPAWYTQAGQMFFGLMALFREFGEGPRDALLLATLLTLAGSGIGGPFYQGFINLADGKPFINNEENPNSEFAFGPISFWWPRPWYGITRSILAAGWLLFVTLLLFIL